ncbi:MAG: hypothetical protein U9Q92_05405 [archaeon]|nr:hypothetical protein [archaeon]
MNSKIRLSGVLAWTMLGLIMGFVAYSVLSLYLMSGLTIALFAGAFSASATILLFKEQESDSDKFFVGLCALGVAAFASGVKYLNYQTSIHFTTGSVLVGVLIGIMISIAAVAYFLND